MIYLYGASGHAKVVIEILEREQKIISGLVDVNPTIKTIFGYPVSREMPDVDLKNKVKMIICVGNNTTRKRLAEKFSVDFELAIHPYANISLRSIIGAGSVVMAGVSVNSEVNIGRHVILNTNCSIDHDCNLENYVHISPNAALAGDVYVGEGAHIGIGACIIQGVKIGRWATIGAGTVIINDVPDYAVVVGNPGRIIKYNKKDIYEP